MSASNQDLRDPFQVPRRERASEPAAPPVFLSRDSPAEQPTGVWIHDLKVLGTASNGGLALAILEKPGGETIIARVGFRLADGWLAAVSGSSVIFIKEVSGGEAIPYSEVVKEVDHADSLPKHGSADH